MNDRAIWPYRTRRPGPAARGPTNQCDGRFGRLRGLVPCGLVLVPCGPFVRAFLSLAFCWGGAEEITQPDSHRAPVLGRARQLESVEERHMAAAGDDVARGAVRVAEIRIARGDDAAQEAAVRPIVEKTPHLWGGRAFVTSPPPSALAARRRFRDDALRVVALGHR